MLKRGDYLMIQHKHDDGVYIKDIAEELGVHPKTVSRALKRGGAPTGKRPRARGSILDPYKPAIDRLLQAEVWNAVVIQRELQGQGYPGEVSLLRAYIRPKRPLRAGRATVRFETAPGAQLQHDWGELWTEIGGIEQKVFIAVNTLGYSRRFHVWGTVSQDAAHTYESLVRSFAYLGGVTKTVLVDNQKSAVIAHRVGEGVQFNPRFLDLAGHYGFVPKACRPYRARTKGKTERMVRYVKEHFFVRYRQFETLAHLNQQLESWLREEADPRVHGTHRQRVIDRFEAERGQLSALPRVRFDTAYREQRFVAWDGYIEVRGNRYSVPAAYCGQPVTVWIGLDHSLRVVDGQDRCVAEHRLRPAGAGWQTIPTHHAALWQDTLQVERRGLAVYEEAGQWN